MKGSSSISIRPMRQGEESFIYSSWLKSYKHSSLFAKRIKHSIFFKWHHLVIEGALMRPTTAVYVATPRDDEDTLLGYIVVESLNAPTLHYLYVKQPFRRLGIAKALLAYVLAKDVQFTHWTRDTDPVLDWLKSRGVSATYNPYLL